MRYLPHTKDEIKSMLESIEKPSLESLFDGIPKALQSSPLNLPLGVGEMDLKKHLLQLSTHLPKASFVGAGLYAHFTPEMVSQQLLRSEWYTAYTPYQPEVSQGTLQAIFEFQTLVANLFGCDVANASMYDGPSAFAEGLLMCSRLKPNKDIFILAKSIHPEYKTVAQTFLKEAGLTCIEIPWNEEGICILEKNIPFERVAAVSYQTPNAFGLLEDQAHFIETAHQNDALCVAICPEPLALGLIHAPGHLGADVVVGEGMGFCGHLSLGGPGVGLFATKLAFLRQMPGRLCGQTEDLDKNRAFVLTLSTREQHIRREKATSNICTNHNLMALAFSICLSLYGEGGFKELAELNLCNTLYLRKKAKALGFNIKFSGPHFHETLIDFQDENKLQKKVQKLYEKNIIPGHSLKQWDESLSGCLLIHTSEQHSLDSIDALLEALKD